VCPLNRGKIIIKSRAIYQHINSILEIRNSYFDQASPLLSNYSESAQESAYQIYENKNLLKVLGIKLHSELKSITSEYILSLSDGIYTIYTAFNAIYKYINKEFSDCQPLELETSIELKSILNYTISQYQSSNPDNN
jgi:hypothetical protein